MVTTLKVLYMMSALIALLINVLFALKAIEARKEGIDWWDRRYQWNPFNLVAFHPEDLTEKGRKYRKLHFTFLGIFVGMCAVGAIISEATD